MVVLFDSIRDRRFKKNPSEAATSVRLKKILHRLWVDVRCRHNSTRIFNFVPESHLRGGYGAGRSGKDCASPIYTVKGCIRAMGQTYANSSGMHL